MSNDHKFHALARMFFEVLDYKAPPNDEIDQGGGDNLLFKALYRKHFHDKSEPWSLRGAFDKLAEEGGTNEDMRSSVAANYFVLAVQCANSELRKLDLGEFVYPTDYCISAFEHMSKRLAEFPSDDPAGDAS